MSSFHIFSEHDFHDYLERIRASIKSRINAENDDYLLNVNEIEYTNHLTEYFKIEPLIIDFNAQFVSSEEKMIPAEWFPREFHVFSGKLYKKNVIIYHIPFSGNRDLFNYRPSSWISYIPRVSLKNNTLCIEIINFRDNPDEIKNRADGDIRAIQTLYTNINNDIDNFNRSVETQVKQYVESRKSQILKNRDVLAALGVPIKKSDKVPATFSINTLKKKRAITVQKPEVHEKGFQAEPTLDKSIYYDILTIIHNVGKEFERLPNVYCGKSEEQLRDHFLMMLEPNFEGSATGETFNKTGKTDILLRHEGENVFIAECKFWKGKKSFLRAISQLLGYLTWRDSKSAVILLVPNDDFSSVIDIVKNSISDHENFIQQKDQRDETWLDYYFHLPGDKNRMVHLAVMLYHLPLKKA